MTKLLSRLLPLACFAGVALSSLSASAAGPSSTGDLAVGLASLPASLRDSLSLPMAGALGSDDGFASSTADDSVAPGAQGLSSFEGGSGAEAATSVGSGDMASMAALGGDQGASAMLGNQQGASPMLVEQGYGASPLGGGVAEALAGLNGGGASMMVGDGMGGSPLSFSHGGRSSGRGMGGSTMSMSAWSTSW